MANVAFSAETWQWVTGEKVVFLKWGSNYPKASHQPYAEIEGNGSRQWENHAEENHKRSGAYECNKAPKDTTLNWIQWTQSDGGNNHWYAINEVALTWKNHEAAANALGAYLATITKDEENIFIDDLCQKVQKDYTWIGLHRTKEPTGPPQGGYERENYTGRPLGTPPPIDRTSPTKSEPIQAQGNYTRQTLRIRTGLN